ncbi:MAG: DUF4214 domain-containing protein, partial [Pseudomonadota bacterium]
MTLTSTQVTNAYLNVLRRAPTPTESVVGANVATVDLLVSSLVVSNDVVSYVAPVIRLYQAAFGRVPDSDGTTYWVNQVRNGLALETVSAQFLGVPEAQSRGVSANATSTAFVAALYQNVLGRTSDTAGQSFWTGQLDIGARTRQSVLNFFSQSSEYQTRVQDNVINLLTGVGIGSLNLSTLNNTSLTSITSSSPGGGVTPTPAPVTTISDSQVTVTAASSTVDEGGDLTYTVALGSGLTAPVSLIYNIVGNTNNGVAQAGVNDFSSVSGTVMVAAGSTTSTFTVTAILDNLTEGLEGFTVTILRDNLALVGRLSGVIRDRANTIATNVSLTTQNDTGGTFNGTVNNDVFQGTIDGNLSPNSTVNAGDVLNGGNGTDHLYFSITGTALSTINVPRIGISNIELISISNSGLSQNASFVHNFDFNGVTGLQEIRLIASPQTTGLGDVVINNLGNLVVAEMSSGGGGLRLNYGGSVISGATDAQSLRLNGTLGGQFTTSGIETLNITSMGAVTNILQAISDVATTSIIATGTTGILITNTLSSNVGNFNGSGLGGGFQVSLSNPNSTVTGSAHNDVISITGQLGSVSIDGGAGTDSLGISDADSFTSSLTSRLTNIENLRINLGDTTPYNAANIAGLQGIEIAHTVFGTVTLVNIALTTNVTITNHLQTGG